jgi:hypothetical protein
MSTIGVNLSIDVSKLDKSRLYKGAKGTYANLTVFIDSNPDQFGKNGGVKEQATKEERDQKVKMPFVGNATIFWSDNPDFQQARVEQAQEPATDEFDDSIPF